MNKPTKTLHHLLAIACLTFSSVSSMATAVRILPWGGNLLDARIGSGSDAKATLLFAGTVTQTFQQKSGEGFLITRLVPGPDGKGQVEEILASAKPLPSGVSAAFYLLTPSQPGAPTPWRLLLMSEDDASLKKGSVRVMNFSELPVAVRIDGVNDKPHLIKPLGQLVLNRAPEQIEARVEISAETDEGWIPVAGQNYGFTPSERGIFLITPPVVGPTGESNGLLSTALIREQIKDPPPKP